jgi:DNA-binding NtrC family response regulator
MAIVLLVDQDPSVRGVLTKALARFGHDALTASNAAEALQALGASHVDLVICDWNISASSQLDGLELLRLLREQDRDVPSLCSPSSHHQHAVSAMRAGATHYLAKPFQNEQLQLTVSRHWPSRGCATRTAPCSASFRVDVASTRSSATASNSPAPRQRRCRVESRERLATGRAGHRGACTSDPHRAIVEGAFIE